VSLLDKRPSRLPLRGFPNMSGFLRLVDRTRCARRRNLGMPRQGGQQNRLVVNLKAPGSLAGYVLAGRSSIRPSAGKRFSRPSRRNWTPRSTESNQARLHSRPGFGESLLCSVLLDDQKGRGEGDVVRLMTLIPEMQPAAKPSLSVEPCHQRVEAIC